MAKLIKNLTLILFVICGAMLIYQVFYALVCNNYERKNVFASVSTSSSITEIKSASDYVEFAKRVNGGETFDDQTVMIKSNIDLSEYDFAEYHITGTFAGDLVGATSECAYKISGIKMPANFNNSTYFALVNKLSGSISGVNFEVEINILEEQNSGTISVIAGMVSASGSVTNCAVDLTINNNSSNAVNVYCVAKNLAKKTVVNNIYINSIFNNNANVYAIASNCVEILPVVYYSTIGLSAGNSNIIVLDYASEPDFWTFDSMGNPVLKIMQMVQEDSIVVDEPNTDSSENNGENNSEANESNDDNNAVETPLEPIEITPRLREDTFCYNNRIPTLDIYFEGADEDIDFSIENLNNANVGDYEVRVVLTNTDKYVLSTDTLNFSITPYIIDITWTNTDLIYNGQQQCPTPSYTLPDFAPDTLIEYGGYGINAGEYIAFAQLQDNQNFALNNATKHYTIAKRTVEINWSDKTEYTFDGTYHYPEINFEIQNLQENFEYQMIVEEGEPLNVGDYTARVSCEDADNYKIVNSEFSYRIVPYVLNVKWGESNLEYNGKVQFPEYEISYPSFYSGATIDEIGAGVDAQKYTAQLFINDNNFTLDKSTKPFEILPYFIQINCTENILTYCGEPQLPRIEYTVPDASNAKITLSGANIDKGIYEASVNLESENNSNFTLSLTKIDYEILSYEIPIAWGEGELTFNGLSQVPSFTTPDLPSFASEINIEYTNNATLVGEYSTELYIANDDSENIILTNNSIEYKIVPAQVNVTWLDDDFVYNGKTQLPLYLIDADYVKTSDYEIRGDGINSGDYTAEIISKNDNFIFINNQFKFTIQKFEIELNWQDTELIYNAKLQNPTVMYQKLEFMNNIDIIVNGAQINVGEYLAKAQIIGLNSDNFKLKNNEVNYNICARNIEIIWDNLITTYNGNPQKPSFTTNEKFEELILYCPEYTDAGTYDLTIECENTNFKLQNATRTYCIQPKPIDVEWGNSVFIYDGCEHLPTASFGSVLLEVLGAQTNAGNYTAECSSLDSNYIVNNNKQEFTILKYVVNVTWSGDNFVYNGKPQSPRPSYDLPNFASMNDFEVIGINTQAGTGYKVKVNSINSNIQVENDTCTYDIAPATIMLDWENVEYVYNGEYIYPQFYYEKTDLNSDVQFEYLGVGRDANTYTATVNSLDKNFVLENNSFTYTIQPYELNASWIVNEYIFNNQPIAPEIVVEFPEFATDVSVIQTQYGTDVGDYTAIAKIYQFGEESTNFKLVNYSCPFEIKPYVLDLIWSNTSLNYNGAIQQPKAEFLNVIDLSKMPSITITGGAVSVGKYVAKATLNTENFTLSNPTVEYIILPQLVEFVCEDIEVAITTPDSIILDNIEVKTASKEYVDLPDGLSYVIGFSIEMEDNPIETMELNFNGETSNEYLIRISLTEDFVVPDDAEMYLLNDNCTKLNWQLNGNVITFSTDSLGVVCLAKTVDAEFPSFILLTTAILVIALVFTTVAVALIKIRNSKIRKIKIDEK